MMETKDPPYFQQSGRILATWTYRGLTCRTAIGGWGGCGYVQLPHGHPDAGHLADSYEVHGGITYGPDADGWLGFDTGHAGDSWPERLVRAWIKRGLPAHRLADLTEDRKQPWDKRWSLAELKRETKRLADQVIDRWGC